MSTETFECREQLVLEGIIRTQFQRGRAAGDLTPVHEWLSFIELIAHMDKQVRMIVDGQGYMFIPETVLKALDKFRQ